jgi:hypothetical protein
MNLIFPKPFILNLLLTSAVLFSCSKDNPVPEPVVAEPPEKYIAFLTTDLQTSLLSNSVMTVPQALAWFGTTPSQFVNPSVTTTVSSVLFNVDTLSFVSPYYVLSGGINTGSEVWKVNGSGNIPSFTLTPTIPFPECAGCGQMPDSISKSKGVTFVVNGISNAQFPNLKIRNAAAPNYCIKILQNGNNTITVTPDDLKSVSESPDGLIVINLSNAETVSLSDNNIRVERVRNITKYIKIVH